MEFVMFIREYKDVIIILFLLIIVLLQIFHLLAMFEIRLNPAVEDFRKKISLFMGAFDRFSGNSICLQEQIRNYQEKLKEIVEDNIDTIDNRDELKQVADCQNEILLVQKNIVSFYKKQILPEQVDAYFYYDKDEGWNLTIKNGNVFYSIDKLSIYANNFLIDSQTPSSSLKAIYEKIKSVTEISIAPEGCCKISLDLKNFKDFPEINIPAELHIIYSVEGKQKELTISKFLHDPLGAYLRERLGKS